MVRILTLWSFQIFLFLSKGKSSLSAGDASIRLPGLTDLNSGSDASNIFTKVLESKNNPYASAHGNSNVQGSVVTIILSRPDGSEIPVQNTTNPISIRLTRRTVGSISTKNG